MRNPSNTRAKPPGESLASTKSFDLPTPSQVGDYKIIRRFPGGSMAELLLAEKPSIYGFSQKVVLKRVRNRSHQDFHLLEEMLIDEAKASASFNHPNLISLIDVDHSEDGVFLVLEYVDGCDLRQINTKLRERREALPFELAVFISIEVLRGLHHAHIAKNDEGKPLEIVHRDINPSNVIIAKSGHIKLADFGVVRMKERLQQPTEPGLVKGKYAYLAPEYISGEQCSPKADIYAAGVMLFELLSGRPCFSGKTAYEVMWKVINKGVPKHRLERENVPEDLQQIVLKATSIGPIKRYPSAQDMANALEAWLVQNNLHATSWVLSVFFQRHNLFEEEQNSSPEPASSPSLENRLSSPDLYHSATLPGTPSKTTTPKTFGSSQSDPSPMNYEIPILSPIIQEELDPLPRFINNANASRESGEIPESLIPVPLELDPQHPPREGKLENIPVVDLLECHLSAKTTGTIEFRCGIIWKRLAIQDGQPYGITSNMGMELIGEHLVKAKVISRDQLHTALRISEQLEKPLTTIMLREGILDRTQLEIELGKNLSSRLGEVLKWRWGTFSVQDSPIGNLDIIPKLDLSTLLFQARNELKIEAQPNVNEGVELDAHRKLEKAIDMAKNIASARGKGKIEQPWRPEHD